LYLQINFYFLNFKRKSIKRRAERWQGLRVSKSRKHKGFLSGVKWDDKRGGEIMIGEELQVSSFVALMYPFYHSATPMKSSKWKMGLRYISGNLTRQGG
jgi:hypothetical protein